MTTVASGQDYSFGDWARDQGYEPGDVMPEEVDAESSGIDNLNGVGQFDWTTAPTRRLWLLDNQLSSIEAGTFGGMTNLTELFWHATSYRASNRATSADWRIWRTWI